MSLTSLLLASTERPGGASRYVIGMVTSPWRDCARSWSGELLRGQARTRMVARYADVDARLDGHERMRAHRWLRAVGHDFLWRQSRSPDQAGRAALMTLGQVARRRR